MNHLDLPPNYKANPLNHEFIRYFYFKNDQFWGIYVVTYNCFVFMSGKTLACWNLLIHNFSEYGNDRKVTRSKQWRIWTNQRW